MKFPYEFIEDPKLLAKFGEWNEDLYCDFMRCQSGEMSEEEFRERYAISVARRSSLCSPRTHQEIRGDSDGNPYKSDPSLQCINRVRCSC